MSGEDTASGSRIMAIPARASDIGLELYAAGTHRELLEGALGVHVEVVEGR